MRFAISCGALCALSLASLPASAEGVFVGGSFGQSKFQDYNVSAGVSTSDDTDGAYRVFGGYLISPLQGLVLSYVDLGEARFAGPAFGGFTDSLKADGFDLSYIIGFAPGMQERITVFGTVGVFAWDQDVSYAEGLNSVPASFAYKDDGTSFSLGLGAEINFAADGSNAWGIHVGWQLFKDVGNANNSGHENDRELFSVGANYRFGRN